MSKLDRKFDSILRSKSGMKSAIIEKGGEVSNVLSEFPQAIQNIQGGGGNKLTVKIDSSRENFVYNQLFIPENSNEIYDAMEKGKYFSEVDINIRYKDYEFCTSTIPVEMFSYFGSTSGKTYEDYKQYIHEFLASERSIFQVTGETIEEQITQLSQKVGEYITYENFQMNLISKVFNDFNLVKQIIMCAYISDNVFGGNGGIYCTVNEFVSIVNEDIAILCYDYSNFKTRFINEYLALDGDTKSVWEKVKEFYAILSKDNYLTEKIKEYLDGLSDDDDAIGEILTAYNNYHDKQYPSNMKAQFKKCLYHITSSQCIEDLTVGSFIGNINAMYGDTDNITIYTTSGSTGEYCEIHIPSSTSMTFGRYCSIVSDLNRVYSAGGTYLPHKDLPVLLTLEDDDIIYNDKFTHKLRVKTGTTLSDVTKNTEMDEDAHYFFEEI